MQRDRDTQSKTDRDRGDKLEYRERRGQFDSFEQTDSRLTETEKDSKFQICDGSSGQKVCFIIKSKDETRIQVIIKAGLNTKNIEMTTMTLMQERMKTITTMTAI